MPFRFAYRGDNLIGRFLVGDFNIFAFVLEKLGFEERRLAGVEHRVDRPILLRDEGANFLFAFHDEAQRNGLDAAGGEAAANFVPEKRRNLIAHNAVEDATGLLSIDEICVHFSRMLEGSANRFGRNFVEGDAKDFLRVDCCNFLLGFLFYRFFGRFGLGFLFLEARNGGFLLGVFGGFGQNHGEVRGDGFPFPVRVTGQIDGVRSVGSFAEIVDDLAFAGDDLKRWLENLFVVQRYRRAGGLFFYLLGALLGSLLFLSAVFFFSRQTDADRFLGQVHHVANGGLHEVIAPQVLINGLRLCGRLNDHKRTCHLVFVTP